jgi:hypothetical protein
MKSGDLINLSDDLNSGEASRTEEMSKFIDAENSDVDCREAVMKKFSDCEKSSVRARELDIGKARDSSNSELDVSIDDLKKVEILEMQLYRPKTSIR